MINQQKNYSRLIPFLCLILLPSSGQGQTKKKGQTTNTSSHTVSSIAGPGSGAIINMQVFASNEIDETLGDGLMNKLSTPLWTYHKISSTSTLRIMYQDSVTHKGIEEGTCQWQIRVDGQQSLHPLCDPLYPSAACMYFNTPLIVASNVTSLSLNSSGLFRGLAAGDHEISIYQRSVGATRCVRNSGGFTTTVMVEEIELP
jgi:hypothetical protein